MKRIHQTMYESDNGTELVKLKQDGTAYVCPASCTPELLDELASACAAAADELRERRTNLEHAEIAS